jgi:UDP-N-acetylmuramoylalanine--D-glutamate ligase
VINLDDPLVQAMPHRAPRVLSFTLRSDVGGDYYTLPLGEDVALMHGGRQLLAMSEMKISGLHNVANALAALAMCDALQLRKNRACRRCANSPDCRIARSGSPTCAACAT